MKQYNYKDLEKIYIDRISPKCKQQLGEKILEPYPQAMIRKALDNSISRGEIIELTARGSWSSKEYPGLLYLVDLYIHPLTIVEALANKVYRTNDPDLIKAMLP